MASRLVPPLRLRRARIAGAVLASLATGTHAMEFDTGDPDFRLRWDTTVKYSLAARVTSGDPVYFGSDNANADDGTRNFKRGLVSNRLDVFTEADLVWQKRFGVRLSGAAYYDAVYNKSNDNPGFSGGAFPNSASVPANEFTKETRDRMGRKAELLDAFVFGQVDAANVPVNARAGQYALTWGESLYFGGNAIAGGMMPVDAVKLSSVPATQFKEAIRPVPMVSASAQLTSDLSVGGYYQLRWRKTVIAPAGSYLSSSDILGEGAEQLLAGQSGGVARQADRNPKEGGQGGLQLRYRADVADFGVYLIHYHEKTPQPVVLLGMTANGPAPAGYYAAYNQGVTALAFSASRSFGLYNVSAEVGLRRNSSLASQATDTSAFAPVPGTNVTDNPAYATGKTAHVNLSVLGTLDQSPLWREASLTAEIAWSRVLSVTKSPAAVDPNGTRDGVQVRIGLEPTYRAVLPGVDLGVPVSVSWAPNGSRPLAAGTPEAWTPENGGDMSFGLNASFRDAWRFTVNYTHFYGSRAPISVDNAYQWKQTRGGRDFVAASARYAF